MNSVRNLSPQGKILIVDDQLDNLRLLSEILVGNGYEVRKAINGSTALMGIKSFVPDLILLDINMPGMNGYQVCQKLKSDRNYKQIPIIFLSASNEVMDKVKAFEVGGMDYITKPFQVPEVLARVTTQIKLRRFSQMRENLSKAIVHDLKNPLSVMTLTSSSLIRRKCLSGKNLAALQTMNVTAQRLDSLLNDLLMVAKMDAEQLVLHQTEVDLRELLISKIIKQFKVAAEAKQINLISKIPDANFKISVDVNLWQRAIENLLSNALKFSPPNSEITIEVTYPESSKVNISVIDQGIGVKPGLHQQIFESYNTGEYIEGVSQIGLGLSFCKMVIEAHGGKISLTDNHPCGAIFTVELNISLNVN
ncbi:MAG: hybrid sensor histidine kinase/response regulator [Cyanobacteria bacterium P01_A01_bin.83]